MLRKDQVQIPMFQNHKMRSPVLERIKCKFQSSKDKVRIPMNEKIRCEFKGLEG